MALLAACTSPEKREAQHLARGIALFEANDDAKAMVEFRNVLRLDPKNAEALYHVGLIHERAGRLPDAYAAYQQAAAERGGFVAANVRLGTLALWAGELDTAARAADVIDEAKPGSPDAFAIRGALALRHGDTQWALELAEKALHVSPQHESAVAVLVGVHHRLGEMEYALERLDEAIAAHPDSASLRVLKVRILEQAEGVDIEAITAVYEELFALQPESAVYRLALADLHRRQGDTDRAEAVLRTAIGEGLDAPGAAEGLVRLVFQERGLDAAATELHALIQRVPDNQALRFMLAVLYVRHDRPEDAEKVLRDVVDSVSGIGPVANDARAAMARIRLASADTAGARKLAEDVIASDREHRVANVVLGAILLIEGDADGAIRTARTALRQDASWLPGLRLVAEAYLQKREANLAVDVLQQIVELAPDDVRYAEFLAQLLTQRGELDGALKAWDQVVRASEDPSAALRARAAIEIQRGNFSAALTDIQHLLETPGQELTGALLAGRLSLAQGRPDEAREWFTKAAEFGPEAPEPVIGIVRSYVAEGDVDGAFAFLDERTKDKPDDPLAFHMKGELLLYQGRSDEAKVAFGQAMRLRPDWLAPYHQLARQLIEEGSTSEAVRVYRAALDQQPDDPDALRGIGLAYHESDAPDAAIESYARLLELVPNDDMVANNYAALIADHRYHDSKALQHALELAARFSRTDNPILLDTLGWLHYRKGDFAAAASYLERAATFAQEDPQVNYHLAMALYRSGQTGRALDALENATSEGVEHYFGIGEARSLLRELRRGDDAVQQPRS